MSLFLPEYHRAGSVPRSQEAAGGVGVCVPVAPSAFGCRQGWVFYSFCLRFIFNPYILLEGGPSETWAPTSSQVQGELFLEASKIYRGNGPGRCARHDAQVWPHFLQPFCCRLHPAESLLKQAQSAESLLKQAQSPKALQGVPLAVPPASITRQQVPREPSQEPIQDS